MPSFPFRLATSASGKKVEFSITVHDQKSEAAAKEVLLAQLADLIEQVKAYTPKEDASGPVPAKAEDPTPGDPEEEIVEEESEEAGDEESTEETEDEDAEEEAEDPTPEPAPAPTAKKAPKKAPKKK